MICWNVVASDKCYSASPRKLLSFARSCRFLSEPAFGVIWDTLPSIWPLLLLLPEDLCEFRHIEGLDPEDSETEFEYVHRFIYGRVKLVSSLSGTVVICIYLTDIVARIRAYRTSVESRQLPTSLAGLNTLIASVAYLQERVAARRRPYSHPALSLNCRPIVHDHFYPISAN